MTPEEEALRRLGQILARHGIPCMLTGSLATSYHGRPRTTHDTDIVIDPTPQQLNDLVRDLDSAGFYVDATSARRALGRRRMFNVIDTQYACKIDLIVRKNRPFSREEFNRRRPVDLPFAQSMDMVSPEDAILSKLEWATRSGEPERHLRDAAGVVEMNPDLDREYIERWSSELGVSDLWHELAGSD